MVPPPHTRGHVRGPRTIVPRLLLRGVAAVPARVLPQRVPRRLRPALLSLGSDGVIARLMNDTPPAPDARPWFRTIPAHWGEWRDVEVGLVELLAEVGLARQAIINHVEQECRLFERFNLLPRRCTHGQHWFITDRLMDCPRHAEAGRKARWRHKHKQKARRLVVDPGALTPAAAEIWRKGEWQMRKRVARRGIRLEAYRRWRRRAFADLARGQETAEGRRRWGEKWLRWWEKS